MIRYLIQGGNDMSVKHFSNDTFQSEVLQGSGPILVDFWAPWCGPCKMLGPVIDGLADELSGKAVVGKVNIDDEPDLAAKYGVVTIPTIILFKDGQEVNRLVGVQSKLTLTQMVEQA
ncbi:thiol reductase thioredoxin [Anaerotruncus colihominis]|uniref:Thioredoxin n=3 Tax=Anaerotruncus colihominis TaxID=169435 RepID=B0PFR6_9FIRM|nr:thioredoxin [Anaerotruncus colihominis DSM 17241]OUO68277.1 thiol reductase thioredoxin [Anaerotruncus colihominis]OUP70135.1 thiol reductase thioredoxin [Anaerotruncus colihominis]OUP74672.1 thiol reductase thioredoxin [Anaerotruncus colihominis]